jgi:hypothetical protein
MKWKSRKLWITVGAALAAAFYPPIAPLVLKLAAVYVPAQAAVDLAERIGQAVTAVKAVREATRTAGS